MKEIIVKIAPDGSSAETEVQGVKGGQCTDITKNLLAALGSVEDQKKTPDYFQLDTSVVENQT